MLWHMGWSSCNNYSGDQWHLPPMPLVKWKPGIPHTWEDSLCSRWYIQAPLKWTSNASHCSSSDEIGQSVQAVTAALSANQDHLNSYHMAQVQSLLHFRMACDKQIILRSEGLLENL